MIDQKTHTAMRPIYFQRRLNKAAPNVDAVIRDPVGTLSSGPLVIGDQPLALVVVLVAISALLLIIPHQAAELTVMAYVLMGLAPLILIAALFFKRRVVMDSQGLEYFYGRRSVYISWS